MGDTLSPSARTRALSDALRAAMAQRSDLGPAADTEFLLRWIQLESGGRYTVVSSLGERGLFQVMESTAKSYGWSREQFLSLSQSQEASIRLGLEEVARLTKKALGRLAEIGASSSIPGVQAFIKLGHGLPLFQRAMTVGFRRAHGRPPTSWTEAATWLRALAKTEPRSVWLRDARGKYWTRSVDRILGNAEKTAFGRVRGTPSSTPPRGGGPDPFALAAELDRVASAFDPVLAAQQLSAIGQ